MDKLAAGGLLYSNFHTNPLCSPSRMALLTGRNNHQYSMAGVTGTNTLSLRHGHPPANHLDDRDDPAKLGLCHLVLRQVQRSSRKTR